MRDRGYDFYWQDKYCDNLYAKDFTVKENENYEVLTAYEVFEHLPEPVNELEDMLKYSENILFSTYLLPADNPKPLDWWYFALDHGQHVSLYTEKSLSLLAKKFNMNLFTNGKNIHLITKKKISGFAFKLLTKPYISETLSVLFKKKSLLDSDYKKVLSNLKSGGT